MHSNNPASSVSDSVRALVWNETGLAILDQRCLPDSLEYNTVDTVEGVAVAIETMQVRGAPAIGIAAAYGVVFAGRQRFRENTVDWQDAILKDIDRLARTRPTAVNLIWALNEMRVHIQTIRDNPEPVLLAAAKQIHDSDIKGNREIGRLGAALFNNSAGVLTHCNTGSLATGGYGTALGVVRSAASQGLSKVFATETRPWLQGARLTVWELFKDGIPATLIADSAAASLMGTGQVQWVIVGADRISANGDVANKIGTYSLAILARHHGLRFMVAAPTSTIDWEITSGDDILIECREQSEFLPAYYQSDESCIDAWNPVFDVTPAKLIDAIVTEKGVVMDPGKGGLEALRAKIVS